MIICEFCLQLAEDGKCAFGLNLPRGMSCREFDPGISKFCLNPQDFVSSGQIIQMATFFGIKGTELKKIKLIAAREEDDRKRPAAITASLSPNESSTTESSTNKVGVADTQFTSRLPRS